MLLPIHTLRMFGLLCALLWSPIGCVHTIHTHPLPGGPTSVKIPRSVQIVVGPILKEGADHMPGINQLKWSKEDVQGALIRYAQARETFTAVSATLADLTMVVGMKLSLTSRKRYWYRIRLQAEMHEGSRPVKTYVAEHEVEGSSVRWVTASDREPIEAAFQRALDDVFAQIEGDRSSFLTTGGRPSK
jgi:hypothetical protein